MREHGVAEGECFGVASHLRGAHSAHRLGNRPVDVRRSVNLGDGVGAFSRERQIEAAEGMDALLSERGWVRVCNAIEDSRGRAVLFGEDRCFYRISGCGDGGRGRKPEHRGVE